MTKFLLHFLAFFLISFVVLAGVQATPFELKQDGSGLTPDNVWKDGEVYSLLGGNINLAAGHYDLTYSLGGTVWGKGHGWEPGDKIIIKASLDDVLIGSTIGTGLNGKNQPFEFSLSLKFNLETNGLLDIIVFSDVSNKKEVWLVDMSNSSILRGNSEIVPTPEPATMLLLGGGLVSLAGFGRKKIFKK